MKAGLFSCEVLLTLIFSASFLNGQGVAENQRKHQEIQQQYQQSVKDHNEMLARAEAQLKALESSGKVDLQKLFEETKAKAEKGDPMAQVNIRGYVFHWSKRSERECRQCDQLVPAPGYCRGGEMVSQSR